MPRCAPPSTGPKARLSHLSVAKMLRALSDGFVTLDDVLEASGLHYDTVRRFVLILHREKVIHIVGWAPDSRGRMCRALYLLGPGMDAPRRPLTRAQRQQRVRDKRKAAAPLAVAA